MKFVLLTEGELERKALPEFLKRWLDPRLTQPVRIDTDIFQGAGELLRETERRATKYLHDSNQGVIGVIALFDLYEVPLSFPTDKTSTQQRQVWAKQHMETKVRQPNFRQFVAVQETEAWLLSAPPIFPATIQGDLLRLSQSPESVNDTEPPAKLLSRLYRSKTGHAYKKVNDGTDLFKRLSPETAYDKCPNLKAMLDEMLAMAKAAGL